jgi:hypothetical protein
LTLTLFGHRLSHVVSLATLKTTLVRNLIIREEAELRWPLYLAPG